MTEKIIRENDFKQKRKKKLGLNLTQRANQPLNNWAQVV